MNAHQASSRAARREAKPPTPVANAIVLIGGPAGLVIWTSPIWPDDWADKLGAAVVPILVGLLVILGFAAVAIAVMGAARIDGWWRYHRRWAKAITRAGLDGTERGERVLPVIERIRRRGGVDVVRVRMLPGQTPGEWAGSLSTLAVVFGASGGRLRLVENHPLRVDLEFDRAYSLTKEKVQVR